MVDVALAGRLLGRHVIGRADDGAGRGERRGVDADGGVELGEAEVEELHDLEARALAREEDVLGLEVAMHDAEVVRGPHRGHHLREDPRALRGVEAPSLREPPRERLSLEEVHHHERRAVLELEEVAHVDHVRVVDGGRRPGLAQEPLSVVLALTVLPEEELERHRASRQGVGRRPYLAHPALSDEALEPIPAREHRTGFDLQARRSASPSIHGVARKHRAGRKPSQLPRADGSGEMADDPRRGSFDALFPLPRSRPPRRALLALPLLGALAGCFAGFDSRWLQQKQTQRQMAQDAKPADIEATPAARASAERTFRVRVRPDAQYLATTTNRFGAGALALMRARVEHEDLPSAAAAQLALLGDPRIGGFVPSERQEEIERLRKWTVESAATAASSAPRAPADGMTAADRDRLALARQMFQAGAVERAYGEAEAALRGVPARLRRAGSPGASWPRCAGSARASSSRNAERRAGRATPG